MHIGKYCGLKLNSINANQNRTIEYIFLPGKFRVEHQGQKMNACGNCASVMGNNSLFEISILNVRKVIYNGCDNHETNRKINALRSTKVAHRPEDSMLKGYRFSFRCGG